MMSALPFAQFYIYDCTLCLRRLSSEMQGAAHKQVSKNIKIFSSPALSNSYYTKQSHGGADFHFIESCASVGS